MTNFLDDYQLPNANSDDKHHNLPIETVDTMAQSLADEFNNTAFKKWYCGVIYEFGLAQVEEWRRRSSDGKHPGKIFSKYVNDCRRRRRNLS